MSTGIEWCDETWNPIAGCSVISPACTNCYAMAQAARIKRMGGPDHYVGITEMIKGKAVWTGKIGIASERQFTQPLRWKRPRRIFVNSMSDLFHEAASDDQRDLVFAIMALAHWHTFQVLTKRTDRMRKYCSDPNTRRRIAGIVCDMAIEHDLDVVLIAPGVDPTTAPPGKKLFLEQWPLPNVWLGVTAEDQPRADERIPDLLATPAAVRFVSIEPMLGPIDLTSAEGWLWSYGDGVREPVNGWPDHPRRRGDGLDWVICGGEFGPHARDNNFEANARDLFKQCRAAGVPFFGKQNVGKHPLPADLDVQEFPEAA